MEAIFEKYVSARFDSVANRAYLDFWCEKVLDQVPHELQSGVFLELLCGTGELLARLEMRPGLSKLGIDLTLRMLVYGATRHDDVGHFVCADARQLPLADNSVNVIAIQGGLHHVANYLEIAISEIARVLAPGGVLVCTEPCNDNVLIRLIRGLVYKTFKIFDPTSERGLRQTELRQALVNSGMSMEDFQPFGYIGFALIGNTDVLGLLRKLRWRPVINFLIWSDDVLARLPAVRRLAWLCIFRARKLPCDTAAGGRAQ